MKQKIMVVEDDEMIQQLITIYLDKAGYDVVTANDGKEAQARFLSEAPCLIVLDLMLPELDGETFCAWVQEQEMETSIVILSAKTNTNDKINLLKLGADSYMTKPFEPAELVAQVEAVLRRTGQFCQKVTYDGLTIQPRKGRVLLHGEVVELTQHEFTLLYYFMQNPNIILSREALMDELYPDADSIVLDRTIDAHIKKLRRKIEENPAQPERIQTVRGMGYKFVE